MIVFQAMGMAKLDGFSFMTMLFSTKSYAMFWSAG
jgi:hypothetical protein